MRRYTQEKYASKAKEVAAACGVPCVDLFALTKRKSCGGSEGGDGGAIGEGLFIDGIHFNARGQEVVFEVRLCKLNQVDP